jgi:hypothetical protein
MPEDNEALLYKHLNRTNKWAMINQSVECERHREEQGERIRNLQQSLIDKGIISKDASKVELDDCVLEAEWSGVLDMKEKTTEPSKIMTKPSIGWTCQPLECHIESDLPVPLAKEKEFVKEIELVEKCAVDIIHHHDDPISPEAHVHVICKGVHPSDLGIHVNRLVKKVLKYRDHIPPFLE